VDVQHRVGEEPQGLKVSNLFCFVRAAWEVAHEDECLLCHLLHPEVDILDGLILGEMHDVDLPLFVSDLQSADVFLRDQISLQLLLLVCLEDSHSLLLDKHIVFFLFRDFLYRRAFISIEFFLYLAPDVDYLAIFDHLLWKFTEKFLL
jgi:hypothetical protein